MDSRLRGNDKNRKTEKEWIPAFAGMTKTEKTKTKIRAIRF